MTHPEAENPIQSQGFLCQDSSHMLGVEFDPEACRTEFWLCDTDKPDELIELSARLDARQLVSLVDICQRILAQPEMVEQLEEMQVQYLISS